MHGLLKEHELPPPRLALQSQSAVTLLISLANCDLLAMVPIQWTNFPAARGMLAPINVKETFRAPSIVIIRCGNLPLTPQLSFSSIYCDEASHGAQTRRKPS